MQLAVQAGAPMAGTSPSAGRGSKLMGNREKQWLMFLFAVLCVGSLIAFGMLYSARSGAAAAAKKDH